MVVWNPNNPNQNKDNPYPEATKSQQDKINKINQPAPTVAVSPSTRSYQEIIQSAQSSPGSGSDIQLKAQQMAAAKQQEAQAAAQKAIQSAQQVQQSLYQRMGYQTQVVGNNLVVRKGNEQTTIGRYGDYVRAPVGATARPEFVRANVNRPDLNIPTYNEFEQKAELPYGKAQKITILDFNKAQDLNREKQLGRGNDNSRSFRENIGGYFNNLYADSVGENQEKTFIGKAKGSVDRYFLNRDYELKNAGEYIAQQKSLGKFDTATRLASAKIYLAQMVTGGEELGANAIVHPANFLASTIGFFGNIGTSIISGKPIGTVKSFITQYQEEPAKTTGQVLVGEVVFRGGGKLIESIKGIRSNDFIAAKKTTSTPKDTIIFKSSIAEPIKAVSDFTKTAKLQAKLDIISVREGAKLRFNDFYSDIKELKSTAKTNLRTAIPDEVRVLGGKVKTSANIATKSILQATDRNIGIAKLTLVREATAYKNTANKIAVGVGKAFGGEEIFFKAQQLDILGREAFARTRNGILTNTDIARTSLIRNVVDTKNFANKFAAGVGSGLFGEDIFRAGQKIDLIKTELANKIPRVINSNVKIAKSTLIREATGYKNTANKIAIGMGKAFGGEEIFRTGQKLDIKFIELRKGIEATKGKTIDFIKTNTNERLQIAKENLKTALPIQEVKRAIDKTSLFKKTESGNYLFKDRVNLVKSSANDFFKPRLDILKRDIHGLELSTRAMAYKISPFDIKPPARYYGGDLVAKDLFLKSRPTSYELGDFTNPNYMRQLAKENRLANAETAKQQLIGEIRTGKLTNVIPRSDVRKLLRKDILARRSINPLQIPKNVDFKLPEIITEKNANGVKIYNIKTGETLFEVKKKGTNPFALKAKETKPIINNKEFSESGNGELKTVTILEKPKLEIKTKTKQVQKSIMRIAPPIGLTKSEQKQKQDLAPQLLISKPQTKFIQTQKPTTRQSTRSVAAVTSLRMPSTKLETNQVSFISTTQLQSQKQSQQQSQRQEQRQQQRQRQLQENIQISRQISRTENIPITDLIKIPKPSGSSAFREKKKKKLTKRQQAFMAWIKVRGTYRPVSKPTSLRSALDIMTAGLKGSLAASGKVTPVNAQPFNIRTQGEFLKYQQELRQYRIQQGRKIPTPLSFIQKRKYRLGTKQEVQQIQSSKKVKKIKWL